MTKCAPEEFVIKSYFLSPNADNRDAVRTGINAALDDWFEWRKRSAQGDGPYISDSERKSARYQREQKKLLLEVAKLAKSLHNEIPRHSPHYIGHMFSEFSLPAFFGHFLALMYNPNNISSEASRVGLQIEKKAIRQLNQMVGFPATALGHFTSGGTIANLEMLYRARLKAKGKWTLIVPESAHYCWEKGHRLMADGRCHLVKVALDLNGRMDINEVEAQLAKAAKKRHQFSAVVSVFGSTELGVIDPIDKVNKIVRNVSKQTGMNIWHHVDAAYGGFFAALMRAPQRSDLSALDKTFIRSLRALRQVDSITLDPHKLGYTPYASGCFLCRSPSNYRLTSQSAPYIDYQNVDPGLYTIEGSRSAAGPFGVFLTQATMGLDHSGLGVVLRRSLKSARRLRLALKQHSRFEPLPTLDTNIVCFVDLGGATKLSEVNRRTLKLLNSAKKSSAEDPGKSYYVSQTRIGKNFETLVSRLASDWGVRQDVDHIQLVRCTVMNPFFETRHSRTDFTSDFLRWMENV